MFKIGKLEKIENEEFWVDIVNINHYDVKKQSTRIIWNTRI